MIGSAAIANLYVANGKADYYSEKDTFIWDVAAGAIIVNEAGGQTFLSSINDVLDWMQLYQWQSYCLIRFIF